MSGRRRSHKEVLKYWLKEIAEARGPTSRSDQWLFERAVVGYYKEVSEAVVTLVASESSEGCTEDVTVVSAVALGNLVNVAL